MKLWILKPRNDVISRSQDNPWNPLYDKVFGFVIRAESEEIARLLAQSESGKETKTGTNPWLDPNYTICEELLPDGKEEIVLVDYALE